MTSAQRTGPSLSARKAPRVGATDKHPKHNDAYGYTRFMSPNDLLDPMLHTRAECTGRGSIVPKSPGAYAWYFDRIPQGVPTEDCHRIGNWILLYVGISPNAPPRNGKPPSGGTIRKRISTHFSRDAEGSTLRRTLGILLAEESGFPLRRVGSG